MQNYKVIVHRSKEREDHKYVARIETGNSKHKYRYFYTMADYKAYLKGKTGKVVSDTSKTKTQTLAGESKTANPFSKLINLKTTKSTTTKDAAEKSKQLIGKMLKTSIKKADKTAEKGKAFLSKVLKTADTKIDKVVKDVDKKIDKIAKEAEQTKKNIDKKLSVNGKKETEKLVSKASSEKVSGITGDGSFMEKAANFVKNVVNGFLKTGMELSLAFYDYKESKTAEEDAPDSLSELKKKKGYSTDDEDQANINPMYDPLQMEWSNNCSYCTAAYDLRQRGYDVEAGMVEDLDGEYYDEILSWYNNPELVSMEQIKMNQGVSTYSTKETEAKAIENELKQYGEGARGHFLITWEQGGGHDVIWEVEHGEVILRDCQTNQTLSVYDYYQYASDVDYFRSDNLEINENILKTVRNKK